MRIVDDEGGDLPERREGVLQFRGPSTMQGYYRNAAATEAVAKPGGWVDSGDRAFVADGEVFITGRVKDIVIRAGRNIYPHEAEEIAADVEGVRRGCVAAFGVRDERQGTEKLVVVVETRVDETLRRQSMTAAIQERLGELFGAPADDVVLVPPGSVPKTSSGKLRRSATKERYLEGKLLSGTDNRRFVLIQVAILEVLDRLWRAARGLGRWLYGIYAVLLSLAFARSLLVRGTCHSFPAARGTLRAVWGASLSFLERVPIQRRGTRASEEPSGALPSFSCRTTPAIWTLFRSSRDYPSASPSSLNGRPVVGLSLGLSFVDSDICSLTVSIPRRALRARRKSRPHFIKAALYSSLPKGPSLGPQASGRSSWELSSWLPRPVVPSCRSRLKGTRRWLRDGTWLPRRSDLQVVIDEPLHATSSSLSEVVRLRDEAAQVISRHVGEPRLDLVAAGLPVAE